MLPGKLTTSIKGHRVTGDPASHPYAGKTAALATKHDKLGLIGPPLERAVGLQVEAVAVDTDSLGTFTGDIARRGTPLETAIAKARLGMSATGQTLGIASEGSIGPDPTMPLVITDRELVVLVDDDRRTVVSGSYTSSDIVTATAAVAPGNDLDALLTAADFPTHQLIARPNAGSIHPIRKGIANVEDLTASVSECAQASSDGFACIETDLRAHACPSRQAIITAAAERLAQRLAALCPSCGSPGWGVVDVLFGIPCAWCGSEVRRPRAEVDGCEACKHQEIRSVVALEARADPAECQICNP